MSEDQLLRDLGHVARLENREEELLDERWDDLSAGTLSPDEEAELRALAAESEQGQEAWDAFRPLDKKFRAQVVETLRARTPRTTSGAKTAAGPLAWLGKALTVPRLRWVMAPAAAAAAAVLLVFLWPAEEQVALPDYHLTLAGGVRELRSASGEQVGSDSPVFVPGNRLRLNIRPDVAVEGEVEVRLFGYRGGELTRWPEPPVTAADSGSFHVDGVFGQEIDLEPGEWTIIVVVGRPGELPTTEELFDVVKKLDAPPPQDWLHRQVRLQVRAQP